MKKIIFLFAILIAGMAINAQTKSTNVTPDGYITKPANVYIFGTTADTLTNADTLNHVVRIQGDWTQDFNIQLYLDHVSGTAGGALILLHSINGVTYTSVTGDTITASSVTSDGLDTEVISKNDFLYPYLKFNYIQTGTAVTVPRVYVYTKKN